MGETGVKVCTKCGEEKEVGEFWRRATSKDGLRGECKKCNRKRSTEWRIKNLDREREKDRIKTARWRKNPVNRLKAISESNKWRLAHPDKAAENLT